MEAITSNLIDIGFMILGSTILGLFGFVWRISHKVSSIEKSIDTLHQLHSRDTKELRKDIEIICNNVDKNREWSTNRMMSIVKEMGS
mgnify:FL=1